MTDFSNFFVSREPDAEKAPLSAWPLLAAYECNKCSKIESLPRGNDQPCTLCEVVHYCCRVCQETGYKGDKKVCAVVGLHLRRMKGLAKQMRALKLEEEIARAEIRNQENLDAIKASFQHEWINTSTTEQMMEGWIDVFRLTVLDRCRKGIPAVEDPQMAFGKFLDKLEGCDEKWAPWLRKPGMRKECERLANKSSGWSSIHREITEEEIQEHYVEVDKLALLRLLAKIARGDLDRQVAAFRH